MSSFPYDMREGKPRSGKSSSRSSRGVETIQMVCPGSWASLNTEDRCIEEGKQGEVTYSYLAEDFPSHPSFP